MGNLMVIQQNPGFKYNIASTNQVYVVKVIY